MTRPSPRELVLWFLTPALLLGVAGWHSYQVAAHDQTPWEGGGFGMFSTADKRQARFVRCHLLTPEDTAAVRLPGHLNTFVERLRARPTEDGAVELANYLAEASWVATPDSARLRSGEDVPPYQFEASRESADRPRVPVDAVRIEVWRYRYGSRPFRLTAEPLVTALGRPSTE